MSAPRASAGRVGGPFPVRAEDIGPLNAIFSDAFSERYRRDGMAGVRVPPLNPAIWRFAIESAGDGALHRCRLLLRRLREQRHRTGGETHENQNADEQWGFHGGVIEN